MEISTKLRQFCYRLSAQKNRPKTSSNTSIDLFLCVPYLVFSSVELAHHAFGLRLAPSPPLQLTPVNGFVSLIYSVRTMLFHLDTRLVTMVHCLVPVLHCVWSLPGIEKKPKQRGVFPMHYVMLCLCIYFVCTMICLSTYGLLHGQT